LVEVRRVIASSPSLNRPLTTEISTSPSRCPRWCSPRFGWRWSTRRYDLGSRRL